MKKLLCLLLFTIVAMACISPVYAQDTYIRQINVDMIVDDQGNATVIETWDMKITEGTEVYKVFNNMDGKPIELIEVKDNAGMNYKNIGSWNSDLSRSEKKNKCGLIKEGSHYEICFGIGDYGDKEFTFTYTIDHFVNQYSDIQGINYAFLSDMTLPIEKLHIDLYGNSLFSSENSRIWGFGYEGSVVFGKNGHVIMENKETLYGEKVQLLMALDLGNYTNPYIIDQSFESVLEDAKAFSNYGDKYEDVDNGNSFTYFETSSHSWSLPFIVIPLVLYLAVFFFSLFRLRKRIVTMNNVKNEFTFDDGYSFSKDHINFFRDIPCGKDPLYFFYLARKYGFLEKEGNSGIISAYLLKWIKEGYATFVKEESTGFLFFKNESYEIDLSHYIPTSNTYEEQLLVYLRAAASNNNILETKEFEKWCKKNYTKINSWFSATDTYAESQLKLKGLLTTQEQTVEVLFGLLKIPQTKKIYSYKVREELEHVYGFKLFLENQNNMNDKEIIDVKLWDEYLIFATILGIAEVVEKQMKNILPEYQQQSFNDIFVMTAITRSFVYDGVKRAESAANSGGSSFSGGGGGSSSSGGGGSSFSGGGGGGVR